MVGMGKGSPSRSGYIFMLIQIWLWIQDQFLGERHYFIVALCHCNSVCLLSVILSVCLSSVALTFVHITQRIELFSSILTTSNKFAQSDIVC